MDSNWPFDDKTMESVRKAFEEKRKEDQESAEKFWNSLSYDDKCNCFHYVVSKVVEGELKEQRSYRGMLYDVFKFGPDMYSRGMDCGFLELHNSIVDPDDGK